MTHYNLVHKFVPMPQAMKILAAKAAGMEKARDDPSVELGKSQEPNGVYSGSTQVHFATFMDK